MKIYTKTGDEGKTSLFGGTRVSKDTSRIEAYGSVDELNSQIGVIRSMTPPTEIDRVLDHVQQQLFVLGADLATPRKRAGTDVNRIDNSHIEFLEQSIDRLEPALQPLRRFVLPTGSQTASVLHVARTVCRRAERRVVQLSKKNRVGPMPIVYLNRLSALLFIMARYVNKHDGIEDVQWNSRQEH
jgi:cob(I)alamin adenosyltransferase